MTTYLIPVKPKPKPRARHSDGRTFHPTEYRDWQREIRAAIVERYGIPTPIDGTFRVEMVFRFPTKPRGDLDNLFAGVMDALQPPGAQGQQGHVSLYPGVLWVDDRNLRGFACDWVPSRDEVIELTVQAVEVPPLPPKPRKTKRKAA